VGKLWEIVMINLTLTMGFVRINIHGVRF
jgi:hypothetical protein